jgi:synaptobrevin family protein YKT6
MKITAIGIYRWTSAESEPILLGVAADVSSFGYFQRQSVREMITFLSRTIVQRTQPGQRQTVKQEDYFCHAHVRDTNLAGIVVADSEYPTTAGFAVVTKAIDEFLQQIGEGWRSASGEVPAAQSVCEQALVRYQVSGGGGGGGGGGGSSSSRSSSNPLPPGA